MSAHSYHMWLASTPTRGASKVGKHLPRLRFGLMRRPPHFWAAALLLVCSSAAALASPEIPGAPQMHPIALVGGVIHPISGPELREGVLLFEHGKIVAVGKDVALPADAEKIDLAGRHIYPGLIDAYTQLGLVEIPLVRATVDLSETGRVNPNVKAQVAVNPDSELIPVTRSGGVLTVLVAPSGGLLSGISAVMELDGWTWEQMTLRPSVGMHVTWPQMAPIHTWRFENSAQEQLQSRDKSLGEIRRAVADARAYQTAKRARIAGDGPPGDFDARWEAMIPVLEGQLPLIVDADEIQQIQSALAFAERENLKLILLGGYDAPHCAELLKRRQVPVIVGGVYRLPRRKDDGVDVPFTVPARLREAGVTFCISGLERTSGVRNLPYHAGMAAAHGLPADEALKAVTLYPAQILGVADRIGSLEAGKDATLIVTTGDPLEIPTQVTRAFIEGREVQLGDRQKRLWEKYKEKYRRLGIGNP
ncbi:MAG TPA: amidohydrolase family protein [Pirellulales bacterium]|nr:amidohydrolase family protein [Pirellulales bacterium]